MQTITKDHWLENVQRELIPGGSPMETRRFLVLHTTDGASGMSSINFWRGPDAKGASAHIVIERDGTIFQCRPFNLSCGHAGKSKWHGFEGLNSCSIGIELACSGPERVQWAMNQPGYKTCAAGGKVWEIVYPAQLAALTEVCKALCLRYNLDDLVTHRDIAPERKQDTGGSLATSELIKLREECGFKGMPTP